MKTNCWLLPLAILGVSACGGGDGDGNQIDNTSKTTAVLSASQQQTIDEDIIVMLASGVDAHGVAADFAATVHDRFGKRPIWRLRVAASAVDATVEALRLDARVKFAERNRLSETPERAVQIVWAYGGDSQAFAQQWAPSSLGLAAAHSLATGAGIRVAVLDSGVDTAHPQLSGAIARDAQGRVLGHDFVDDDDDASDPSAPTDAGWGHGTHVAGLVNLSAPAAQIMPVRVLDSQGQGNLWVLAEALMWAIDPDGDPATDDGAHVVNISLGTSAPTRLLNTAIELATCSDDDDNEDQDDYSDTGFDDDRQRCDLRKGTVVMASAGNGGSSDERSYPAAEGAEGQLAITSFDADGSLSSFSNRGAWVQLAAPGGQIVSTLPGGAWGAWSGTSMATPLASGVAALVLERNRDWKPVDVTKRLLDRSVVLCGTSLHGLHAHGAVADFVPAATPCP